MSVGQEPPAGSTPQTEASQATLPVAEAQETVVDSDTGLVKKWEQAEDALWEAKNRVNAKARGIFNDSEIVLGRLKELGLLPTIPNKERPEIEVLKGILIGKDGRELEVSAGDYGTFFSDLVDPTRRDVQITHGTIDLILRSKGVYIDQIGKNPWMSGAVGRTDNGQRARKNISKEAKDADLRGDLGRDVLDAAREGLDFILDPGTTLKSAGIPTSPRSTVNTTPTS